MNVEKPVRGFAGYTMAKLAQEGLLQTMALEWDRFGIKTLSVCPGSMDSGLFAKWPEHIQKLVAPEKPLATYSVAEKILLKIEDYSKLHSGERLVINS